MKTAVNINSDELRKALKAYHIRRGNTDVWLSTRRLKKSGSYISCSLSSGRMEQKSLEELCRIIDVDISKIIDSEEKIEKVDIKPLAYVKPSAREAASRSSAPSYKNDVRKMLDKISEKQEEIVTAQLEINTLLYKCWEELKK